MAEREILVADSDTTVRSQMAECFRKAGYQVETTDSAVHVFCTVLEKQIPVVLLGSGCDKKIALADLVPLLKKCNRGVTIILVSDEESLPTVRSIRQEGIFYHALKPAGSEDTEEILAAVECAFNRTERSEKNTSARTPAGLAASVAPRASCMAGLMTKQAAEEPPEPITPHTAGEQRNRREKTMKAKAAALLTALTAAIAGFVYCVVAATRGIKENGDLVVWGFLGFCALIIVGQLIPAFFSFMAAKKVVAEQLQVSGAEEQPAPAVFDKSK